jgi:hypothetical protein
MGISEEEETYLNIMDEERPKKNVKKKKRKGIMEEE